MLQFLLSLSRQSNPSILTAGLLPKFSLAHATFLADDDGEDDIPEGIGIDLGERGVTFASPKWAS